MTPMSQTVSVPRGQIDDSLWIDNQRLRASGETFVDVDDSASEAVIASVRSATRDDVDRAFAAARRAQTDWARVPVEERIRVVREATRILEASGVALADVLVSEVGTLAASVDKVQVGFGLKAISVTADSALHAFETQHLANSVVVRQPAGVVAAITPWNYPIFQVALKLAPAVIAGCSVVLKPPGVAPLTAFAMAEAFALAGLPAGVFNIVCGAGGDIGNYLAGHAEADFVSFTGSVAAGRAVAMAAAGQGTRNAMELGGKSAAIVWDDHLLEDAVRATFANVISNTGQTCAALTRLVVPQQLLGAAEGILTELVAGQVVGDPRSSRSTIGPMSNRGQRETVEAYLREATADSRVRLVAQASMDGVDKGWFVAPTVYTATDHSAPIVQEEIFGPVLTVQPYATPEEAIFLANATRFGLVSRVWTDDPAVFQRVAGQLHVGGVIQSGRPTAAEAPFGGVKDSGYGRERGLYGLEEYLVPKSIQAY